ncbi:glucokinase [Planctomycetota bacterium]|nr:glucokinase [Planctomycetota bacterium]
MARKIPLKPLLGIDLGGTKIHAVTFLADAGKITVLGTAKRETRAERGYKAVLKRIAETAADSLEDAGLSSKEVAAVGCGAPGPVDAKGTIAVAANLGWKDRPLGKDLSSLLNRPVTIGNDVNCGALGEATHGSARGTASAFFAFVGTGLGGALIVDGRILNGAHGYGGEIGHLPAPFGDQICGCGRPGCLETTASKTGIVRIIKAEVAAGTRCLLPQFSHASGGSPPGKSSSGGASLKSKELKAAWQEKCPATRAAVSRCGEALAWGLAVVGQTVDPTVFVLGGGVAEALGPALKPHLLKGMRERSMLYRRFRPEIRLAALGDDSVAVGAAVAAMQALA